MTLVMNYFLRYCMKQHSTTNCNKQYQLPPVGLPLRVLIHQFIRHSLVVVRPIIRLAGGEQLLVLYHLQLGPSLSTN